MNKEQTKESLQQMWAVTYLFIGITASMADEVARQLVDVAREDGCYRQADKRSINAIADGSVKLMQRIRLLEHHVAESVVLPQLKTYRKEYPDGDFLLTTQYAIRQAVSKPWTVFQASTQNLVYRGVRNHAHTMGKVLIINGVVEIITSASSALKKMLGKQGYRMPQDTLMPVCAQIRAETRKLMESHMGREVDENDMRMKQAQQALDQLNDAIWYAMHNDMKRVIGETKTMYVQWYIGRSIIAAREAVKLPAEVKAEWQQVYGTQGSVQLLRLISQCSRQNRDIDDPLDMWDAVGHYPTFIKAASAAASINTLTN